MENFTIAFVCSFVLMIPTLVMLVKIYNLVVDLKNNKTVTARANITDLQNMIDQAKKLGAINATLQNNDGSSVHIIVIADSKTKK